MISLSVQHLRPQLDVALLPDSNEESEGVVGRRRIFVRGYGKSEPKKGTRGR